MPPKEIALVQHRARMDLNGRPRRALRQSRPPIRPSWQETDAHLWTARDNQNTQPGDPGLSRSCSLPGVPDRTRPVDLRPGTGQLAAVVARKSSGTLSTILEVS